MQIEIKRMTVPGATLGLLLINYRPKGVTLENPWLRNARNLSCIPAGAYRCEQVNSKRYGHTLRVLNVLNRTDILFHWGNTPKDTEGCILVGTTYGWINRQNAITESRKAMQRFRKILATVEPGEPITLFIGQQQG